MFGYVIAGGTILGLAALMAHGEDDSFWSNTMQMVGILVILLAAGAALVWVATYR